MARGIDGTGLVEASVSTGAMAFYVKEGVFVATTTALPANTASADGLTLTANANGALPNIDGLPLALGDPLLVKDEGGSSPAEHPNNGIYIATSLGDDDHPWVLTRRDDANSVTSWQDGGLIGDGMTTYVREGSTNALKQYAATSDMPFVLGTTGIGFFTFGGSVSPATPSEVVAALALVASPVVIGNNQPVVIGSVAGALKFGAPDMYDSGALIQIASIPTYGIVSGMNPGASSSFTILTADGGGTVKLGHEGAGSWGVQPVTKVCVGIGGYVALNVEGDVVTVRSNLVSLSRAIQLPSDVSATVNAAGKFCARSNGQMLGFVGGSLRAVGAMIPANYDALVGPVVAQVGRRYYSSFRGDANNAIALPAGSSCLPGDQIALKSLYSTGAEALYWEITPGGADAIDGVAGARNFLADGKASHVLEWSDDGWLVVVGGS